MPEQYLISGFYAFAQFLNGRDSSDDPYYDTAYRSHRRLTEKLAVAQVASNEAAVAQIIAASSILEQMTADEMTTPEQLNDLAEKVQAALYSLRSYIEGKLPPSEAREAAIEYSMPRRSAPVIGDAFMKEKLDYLIPWVNAKFAREPSSPPQFLVAAE